MSRLVLAAVVVLVAVAAADAVRPKGKEHVRLPAEDVAAAPVVHRASSGYVAVGPLTRNRVLRFGREYLSAASVDAAFPGDDVGEPLDISHLATAPDGTLALAVYRFPAKDPAEAAIELWRRGRLVSAFRVPAGAFGGGLGFAYGGRLVATLLSDGFNVLLFSRTGERAGSASATSW
ncbi:MAG TPA: hypothetical protein VFW80_07830 [Gaiellaceae bacterium]|nr:hypothetical protein [Gaiellaceae bacterium]